jgi:hypothetical protein
VVEEQLNPALPMFFVIVGVDPKEGKRKGVVVMADFEQENSASGRRCRSRTFGAAETACRGGDRFYSAEFADVSKVSARPKGGWSESSGPIK